MFNLFRKQRDYHFTDFPGRREFVITPQLKYPLFLYRHLHKKMIEVISAVFEGYPEEKYIFYPPSDLLSDSFDYIRNKFLEIDIQEEFQSLPVTDLRTFEHYSNYKETARSWEYLKKDIYEEQQMLVSKTQFGYHLPNDLQVRFYKLDKLVSEHIERKNKLLKENNIYPADELLSFGAKESDIKTIFKTLSQANGEWVKLKDISPLVNNMSFPKIRIVISQIKKKIKEQKKENQLKIENNRQSAYRLVIS